MAMDQAERGRRRREKAERLQEEDLRLNVRPGTKQALLELMEWSGIEEQGEAKTRMIRHLHGLDPHGALPLQEPPRREISVSPSAAEQLERLCSTETARTAHHDK